MISKPLPENFESVARRKMTGEISWTEAGRLLNMSANTARELLLREFPDATFLPASSAHPAYNKVPLEEYRQRVAELEAKAERYKRLYEQTGRIEHRDRWEAAKLRFFGARTYLRKREKQEAV